LDEQLGFVEAYLIDKYDTFISFDYNEINSFDHENNVITVNTRQSKEKQLYSLLHEAGHLLLSEREDYDSNFSDIIQQPFKKKFSRANAVSVVRNEVLAWEKGYELAMEMGIEIDKDKWNKLRDTCLFNYLKWSTGV